MKTLKFSTAIILLLSSILFSSCNKDELSLITDKTWVLTSVNMAGMDMTPTEILAEEGAEYQMILNTNGTVTYMDNMGMNAISGKWEFQKNNTQFVISGIKVGESDLNTITKLTSTDLWFWHMDGTEKMIMHYKVK